VLGSGVAVLGSGVAVLGSGVAGARRCVGAVCAPDGGLTAGIGTGILVVGTGSGTATAEFPVVPRTAACVLGCGRTTRLGPDRENTVTKTKPIANKASRPTIPPTANRKTHTEENDWPRSLGRFRCA
jgi:hypothetical protein